jgi:hypothetical protein
MGMTTLRKRLEKLEMLARGLTDDSGLVPLSQEWLEYWHDQSSSSPQRPRIPGARMSLGEFRMLVAIARGG